MINLPKMPSMSLKGKTAIITGASSGIGQGAAAALAGAGASVICVARGKDRLVETEKALKENGWKVKSQVMDVNHHSEIQNIFETNKIDIVVNAAGQARHSPAIETKLEDYDAVMDVNLKSFFVICKEAVNLMKQQKYGRIVNVSSIAGRNKSIVSGVHYTSSKYGIIGLTKQLANEVSKHNILVNCICPSQTMTEMLKESMTEEAVSELEQKIPIRRIATTTEQALPVLFLCSNAASYITGAAIDINGGQL